MDPQLGIAVVVEIQLFVRQRLALAQRALGRGELAPDRVAQMREGETAEYAVPVGVVALGAADGPPGLWGVATTVRQRGQRHHHLVHAVGLRVLHQEMVPVSSPHERRRRGEVLGAELCFQPSEVHLHFPIRRGAEIRESS